MLRILSRFIFLVTVVALSFNASASTDYAPAVTRLITCSKYYTTGYGKKFVVIHDMEGYYLTGLSYLQRCDLNASGNYNVAVSCHYVVNGLKDYASDAERGEVSQLVREANYSWHAGCWNRYSTGTEHEGFASNPAWYTEEMYQSSSLLHRHLCDKFAIAKDRNHVIAHGQKSVPGWSAWASANLGIDPNCNTHTDPGPYWNWNHYMDLLIGQVNNASVVSGSVPSSVPAGSTFSATITMNNNGSKPWTTDSTAHKLGSQNPQDNSRWGFTRVGLPGTVNPGANAVFTFNATAPATPGTYAFEWKMLEESVEWFGATYTKTITVTTAGPTITSQPQSKTVAPSSNVTFTVVATGSGGLTYQWRRNLVNLSNGGKVSGATTASLTVANVQQTETGNYSVMVTDSNGPTTSADATLAVTTLVAFNETFETGNLNNWGLASNAAAPNATMPAISTAQKHGGTYSALVDISSDRMYRNIGVEVAGRGKATFWIYDSSQTRVFTEVRSYTGNGFEQGTLDQLLCIGKYNTVTLAGEVFDVTKYQGRIVNGAHAGWFNLNGAGAPSRSTGWHKFEIERLADFSTVNWYVDGVLCRTFTGLTSPAWDCVVVGSVGAGSTAGDAWIDDFKVEYYDPPAITTQPTNEIVPAGFPATFGVGSSGTVTGIQWRKNNVNLSNGGNISGATSTTLTINNAQAGDAANYNAVVSNGAGPTNSATVLLKVSPTITLQPVASTNIPGDTATFTVAAGGQATLVYQWKRNGVNLTNDFHIFGADEATLELSAVIQDDEANYSVIVSNAGGVVASSSVALVVLDPPIITAPPNDWLGHPGENVTFTVSVTGTPTLFYQWRFNDENINGATTSSFSITNVQPEDGGGYSVEISNAVDTVISLDAVLAFITPTPHILSPEISGENFTLTWNSLAGKTYRVQYKDHLEDEDWTDLLPDVIAEGTTASKTDAVGNNQRFYRILSLDGF